MKINKNSVIELADGLKLWIVNAKVIDGKRLCLVSTMQEPVEMKVAELHGDKNKAEIRFYTGADYDKMFAALA